MPTRSESGRTDSRYCTTREAADLLGISLRTAQLWVDSGALEAWKTDGGHRRIKLSSVERLLREQGKELAIHATPSTDNKLKILVVEDDNVLLRLYRLRIEKWGMPTSVLTASNAYEALMVVGRAQPDLMITDLNMPGLDGLQMIRSVQSSSLREGMEIVIVSGLDKADVDARGGVPAGITLLPKPVPFDALRTLVQRLLDRRAQAGF